MFFLGRFQEVPRKKIESEKNFDGPSWTLVAVQLLTLMEKLEFSAFLGANEWEVRHKKTTNMIVAPVCMCIFWYLLIYHEMCWYLWLLMVDIDSFSSSALWGLVTVDIMFDIDRGSVVDLVWDSLIWFQSSFGCFLCFSITVDWVNLRFCS